MKNTLQITLSKTKGPKTKLGKFLFWRIWWPIWYIWRKKLLASFYGAVADFLYWLAPKSVKEEIDKELESTKINLILKEDELEL